MSQKNLFNQILEKAKKQRRRIGIGLLRDEKEVVESLKKAQEFVDVVPYGIKLDGFECIELSGEEAGLQMVKDFKSGKIDQFVRGQVDDLNMVEEFKKQFNIDKKEKRIDFAMVEDNDGWQIFLTAASNPDAQNLEDKIRIIDGVTQWLTTNTDIKPRVAVMATCRPGSYGKDPVMSQTYDEAEAVVKHLAGKGIEAKNVHIEIEKAKEWGANVILPARGTIGNQIFRAIYYLGGGKMYFCPTILSSEHVYEDNSRNETDYFPHLIFAQSLANK